MKVVLAYPYTDGDGKLHAPDETVDLDVAEANRLLFHGLARVPEPAPEPVPEPAPEPVPEPAPEKKG